MRKGSKKEKKGSSSPSLSPSHQASDVDIGAAKKLGLFDDSELALMMSETSTSAGATDVDDIQKLLEGDKWQELEGEALKLRGSTPLPSSPSVGKADIQTSSSFSNLFRSSGISFNKQYLVMQAIQLAIYKSREEAHKPGTNPSKLIPLERVENINPVPPPTSKEHANSFPFEFLVGKKVVTFAVSSEKERSLWIETIRKGSTAAKKSGTIDMELNEEQRSQMDKMRIYLPRSTGILEQDEVTLIRFLRSRQFTLATSVGSFKESLRFRQVNNVDKIRIADVYHEAKRGLAFFPGSQDRKGHRVQILKAGAYSRLEKVCPRQAMKYLVYLRQKEVWEKGLKDILLVDLAGININSTIMFVNRTYYYLMDYIFPSTTGMVIMFNTPWWIRAAWSVAKSLVDPEQRNAVVFLGSNLNLLKELVGEEALPKEYGGAFVGYNHEEWIKERFKIENLNVEDVAPYAEDSFFMTDVFPDFDDVSLDVTVAGSLKGAVKFGYLTKLGGNVHNWKKRFFILKSHSVYYYKDEKPTTKPQGSVRLEHDVQIQASDEPPKKGPGSPATSTFLELVTPRRTYVFRAATTEERDEWVKTLLANRLFP